MLQNIDHIGIVVTDLIGARDFFLALGFTVIRGGSLQGQWIDDALQLPDVNAEYLALHLPNTQTNIELLKFVTPEGQKDPLLGKPNQIGIRHIAFAVHDIEAFVHHLKQKGIKTFSGIQIYDGQKKFCYFSGVEGIICEVAEYL